MPRWVFDPRGKELSLLIEKTEASLGLHETVGCAPTTYHAVHHGLDQRCAVELYAEVIIPHELFDGNDSRAV